MAKKQKISKTLTEIREAKTEILQENKNITSKTENPAIAENESGFVLSKINYIILAAGFLLIIIGFVLMSGGKSEDPNVFNQEIFNFRRITLAPIIILLGFITEIFAIMWRPKSK
jgi:hypothetical protein